MTVASEGIAIPIPIPRLTTTPKVADVCCDATLVLVGVNVGAEDKNEVGAEVAAISCETEILTLLEIPLGPIILLVVLAIALVELDLT
jgi:hypothetical protein